MKLYAIEILSERFRTFYWPNNSSASGEVSEHHGTSRKFSTAGDAVAFLHTMSDGRADFPIVPVPPAAMLQAEAAARAGWIDAGGRVGS